MAFLIAFEGIDGSGKGTQSRRLQTLLNQEGLSAALLSFPRYEDTLFGKGVADFLNGRFGRLEDVSPFLVSLLYAGDRFESRPVILDAVENHEVVIFDRYVPSNIAHQGAKLSGAEREEVIRWIEKIEYGLYQLPKADLVVLLDLPASHAQQLIARKQTRSYTDQKSDLQEDDADYLARVREVYLQLAARSDDWKTISCCRDRTVLSVEEIGDQIAQIVRAAVRPG